QALFGDDQFANIAQLGAAYQAGAIGLSAQAIERAIEANGTAVAANIQAFRRGRQAVADPAGLERDLRGGPAGTTPPGTAPAGAAPSDPEALSPAARRVLALVAAEPGSELARVLAIRVPDLIAYSGVEYAARYARFVEHVRSQAPDAPELAVA